MTQYKIINISDYILIESNGELLLVDTGCPVSFNQKGKMTLCGETFTVPESIPPFNVDTISKNLKVSVQGLVGRDYISKHPMSVDVRAGLLTFDCSEEGWKPLISEVNHEAILLTMNVKGRLSKFVLDTGAPIAYISRNFTDGENSIGTRSDYSPFIGKFETDIYSLPCSLAGHDFDIPFGNLPTMLADPLSMIGAAGAIGMDLFKEFKILISGERVFVS